MTPLAFTLIAIAFSSLCLLLLALSDPKRARASRRRRFVVLSIKKRRVLTVLLALPSAVFIAYRCYAPLLLWLGSVLVTGWLLALVLPLLGEAAKAEDTSRQFFKIQK